ncbi:hypothetical protein ACIQNG_34205 [Streptomyces sp. NPDC091377]|uniref:hypothetical protein n=1 Tax=Streptomyces sp. NPDC091377 TaxID=3365995 RepID=UPI0038008BA7
MPSSTPAVAATAPAPAPPPRPALAPDDLRLLRLLAAGITVPVIAGQLDISPSSVSERVRALRATVGARTTVHAVSLGVLHGVTTCAHVPLRPGTPVVRDEHRPVLHAACSGDSAAQIAARLHRSRPSVDQILTRLRYSFSADNRAHLAAAALLTGRVPCSAADDRFPPLPLPQHCTRPGPPGKDTTVFAVITHGTDVLLIRPHARTRWEFPHAAAGTGAHSRQRAAVHAALLHSGVKVFADTVIGERPDPHTDTLLAFVACTYISGTPLAATPDAAQVHWAPIATVLTRLPHLYPPVRIHLNGLLEQHR